MHRNCCTLCKSNYKDCLIIVLWISLKKGVCFNLNHSLGFLPYSVDHQWTCRSSLIFQLAELLSLFSIQ